MIFVFGSNLAGRHGKGAALAARKQWGAEYGVGSGPTGNAYAIPTKDERLASLPLSEIEVFVQVFLSYARANSDRTFLVTRVGCGYAGYSDNDIAPLFDGAPINCIMPVEWAVWYPNHPLHKTGRLVPYPYSHD